MFNFEVDVLLFGIYSHLEEYKLHKLSSNWRADLAVENDLLKEPLPVVVICTLPPIGMNYVVFIVMDVPMSIVTVTIG